MFETLKHMQASVADRPIGDLFAADPQRAETFSADCADMRLDYSKTNIDAATRAQLIELCQGADLAGRRERMFSGALINQTENRAVLHTALRNLDGGPVLVAGQDVMPGVLDTLARMRRFSDQVRRDGIFLDVVNIGIGGSDLGPAMAVAALRPPHYRTLCHFVSNVDGGDIADCLRGLDPERTLVIVASKTFTTIETMTNARTALAWLVGGGGDAACQFAALSSAADRTADFGIKAQNVFGFADWVGGRYSLWGPIGLSLMIAIGPDRFDAFLRGGQTMDRHFRAAPYVRNLPVMLALTGIWHHQICGYATRAVLPYEQRLVHLPRYLQQLEMESNGKSVRMDGQALGGVPSGPVVWGTPGTNGQHAFFQLVHQGTDIVPCEFLIGAQGHEPELAHHHRLLVANCLAQSKALMQGRSMAQARALAGASGCSGRALERQARHRVFAGNRPSTTLVYPKLTPSVLGRIIALYEHRVFVEGVILGINSFDQWGVELGKELATSLGPVIAGTRPAGDQDGSTAALVRYLRHHA